MSIPVGEYIGDLVDYPYLLVSVLERLSPKDRLKMCSTNKRIKEICEKYFPPIDKIYERYRKGKLNISRKDLIRFETYEGPIFLNVVDFRNGETFNGKFENVDDAKKELENIFSSHPEYKGSADIIFSNGILDLSQETLKWGEVLEFKDPPITNQNIDSLEGLEIFLNKLSKEEKIDFFRRNPQFHQTRKYFMSK